MTDTMEKTSRRAHILSLLALLLLTLCVRLPALFAPLFLDEAPLLRNVAHFVSERTLLPVHFSYPPLYSYLATPATGTAALLGGSASGLGARDWALIQSAFAESELALGGRLLSLLCALGLVALAWRLIPRELGAWPRFAGGLIVVFSPVSIEYSAYFLPDVAAGLGALAAAGLSIRYLSAGKGRDLIIAGALGGLAAAFKYNAALVVLAVGLAAVLAEGSGKTRAKHLALAAGASLGTFLLLAPTWWLLPGQAWAGFRFESANVHTARVGGEAGPLVLLGRLSSREPGWILGFLAGGALLWRGAWRRPAVLLVMPLANLLFVATWAKQDMNYFLPSFGMVAVLFGEAYGRLIKTPDTRLGVAGVLAAILLGLSYSMGSIPLVQSNRALMAETLAQADLSDEAIVRLGFYTPKVWDQDEVAEFLEGRGSALSERGREAFEGRLAKAPYAENVYTYPELEGGRLPGEDVYILTTGRHVSRYASEEDLDRFSEDAQREIRLAKALAAEDGWTMRGSEGRGTGPSMILYQRDAADE